MKSQAAAQQYVTHAEMALSHGDRLLIHGQSNRTQLPRRSAPDRARVPAPRHQVSISTLVAQQQPRRPAALHCHNRPRIESRRRQLAVRLRLQRFHLPHTVLGLAHPQQPAVLPHVASQQVRMLSLRFLIISVHLGADQVLRACHVCPPLAIGMRAHRIALCLNIDLISADLQQRRGI